MTTATDELRKLLDERDEDYSIAPDGFTTWWHDTGEAMAWEDSDGVLTIWGLTPEQVITATLGDSRADDFWPIAEITTDHIDLKHGRVKQRWIPERTCQNKSKSGTSFWCSKCDAATSDGFADIGGKLARFNYCPNCGCKVVGE